MISSTASNSTRIRRVWVPPALLALVILLAGIDRPSLWRDEAVTISVARRPVSGILELLGHVDAVHGLYYLLMHPVVTALGAGEWAVRLPSALAGAAAAGGVAVLTRRLGLPAAALPAGLLYALAPLVSRYGQDARSYELVSAVAVLACYLFVRALQAGSWRWYGGYASALGVLGLLHLLALLLVIAHATTVILLAPPSRRRFAGAAALGCAPAVPLAFLAASQTGAISWMTRPGLAQLGAVVVALTGTGLFAVPLAWLAVRLGRSRLGRPEEFRLVAVVVPWLLIPPALLLVTSQFHPLYDLRYVLFCLPAAAILAGAALAEWRTRIRVTALALTGALALPFLIGMRQEGARFDDLRGAARILRSRAAPGDAVLYLPGFQRSMAAAYPDAFRRLDDVALKIPPAASATLEGITNPWPVTAARLAGRHRAWLLSGPDGPAAARQISALRGCGPYALEHRWRLGRLVISLYAR